MLCTASSAFCSATGLWTLNCIQYRRNPQRDYATHIPTLLFFFSNRYSGGTDVKNARSRLRWGVFNVCARGNQYETWPDETRGDIRTHKNTKAFTEHTHTHTVLSLHSNPRQNWWAKSYWLVLRRVEGGLQCLKNVRVCVLVGIECDFEKGDSLVYYTLGGD